MTSSLIDSLRLTFIGMAIVFVSLYALSLIMDIFPKLFGQEKRQEEKQAAVPSPMVQEPPVGGSSTDGNRVSPQTIAVIASAVAAYLGRAPEDLNLISIRRTGPSLSPWALQVRRESVKN